MSDTTLGPTGGNGGQEFGDYTVPAGASVREVHIFAGLYVDAIQLKYLDANDVLVELPKIGGHGFPSASHHVVTLEPGEVIIGVSGRSGGYVDSIRIQTNKRVTDSFGGFSGVHEFHFAAPENSEIVGFFGRADWFVDALGVVVRERAAVAAPAAAKAAAAKPAKAKKAPAKIEPAAETPTAEAKPAKAKKAAAKPATTTEEAPVESAPARSVPVVDLAAVAPAADDLIKVEGIGPKIATLLIEAGIPNLQVLADTPVERLREILNAAGSRYRISDPTTWPQQAALGAQGDWAGMETLQATLRAGRTKA